MEQVSRLQEQLACLARHQLQYQVLHLCSTLERNMEAMKEEIELAMALKGVTKVGITIYTQSTRRVAK